jgi:hypothetical protein
MRNGRAAGGPGAVASHANPEVALKAFHITRCVLADETGDEITKLLDDMDFGVYHIGRDGARLAYDE